jgi:hypothetical protein
MSTPVQTNISVAADKVYVPLDTVDFLAWDPAGPSIGEVVSAPDELLSESEDLPILKGYGAELRGRTLFQPYYFNDNTYEAFAELSQVSVIDTKEDEVIDVLDVPCPHLHISSQDTAGNIYMSNGQGSVPAATLKPDHPKNCFFTIPAGSNKLDEGSITYFADIADGREGSNFFYVEDGLALFSAYHAEREEITDETTVDEIAYSANYHIWTYNMKSGKAAPMEGMDYGGGQFVAYRIDGRVYLTVPNADYSETAIYEITKKGAAKLLFSVEGWGFKLLKVR